jgi:hypothetical protein
MMYQTRLYSCFFHACCQRLHWGITCAMCVSTAAQVGHAGSGPPEAPQPPGSAAASSTAGQRSPSSRSIADSAYSVHPLRSAVSAAAAPVDVTMAAAAVHAARVSAPPAVLRSAPANSSAGVSAVLPAPAAAGLAHSSSSGTALQGDAAMTLQELAAALGSTRSSSLTGQDSLPATAAQQQPAAAHRVMAERPHARKVVRAGSFEAPSSGAASNEQSRRQSRAEDAGRGSQQPCGCAQVHHQAAAAGCTGSTDGGGPSLQWRQLQPPHAQAVLLEQLRPSMRPQSPLSLHSSARTSFSSIAGQLEAAPAVPQHQAASSTQTPGARTSEAADAAGDAGRLAWRQRQSAMQAQLAAQQQQLQQIKSRASSVAASPRASGLHGQVGTHALPPGRASVAATAAVTEAQRASLPRNHSAFSSAGAAVAAHIQQQPRPQLAAQLWPGGEAHAAVSPLLPQQAAVAATAVHGSSARGSGAGTPWRQSGSTAQQQQQQSVPSFTAVAELDAARTVCALGSPQPVRHSGVAVTLAGPPADAAARQQQGASAGGTASDGVFGDDGDDGGMEFTVSGQVRLQASPTRHRLQQAAPPAAAAAAAAAAAGDLAASAAAAQPLQQQEPHSSPIIWRFDESLKATRETIAAAALRRGGSRCTACCVRCMTSCSAWRCCVPAAAVAVLVLDAPAAAAAAAATARCQGHRAPARPRRAVGPSRDPRRHRHRRRAPEAAARPGTASCSRAPPCGRRTGTSCVGVCMACRTGWGGWK